MNNQEAKNTVAEYLRKSEEEINSFGIALPGYQNPNIKLMVLDDLTREYEFGWVFFYNTEKFIKTGNNEYALAGNAPLIIDRKSEKIIVTGTAHEIDFYINNYIQHGDPHHESI